MAELRVYVEVDMEGISNITNLRQVVPGNPEYEKAREYMTLDTNAAVRGIFRAAEKLGKKAVVDVVDSHWKMNNILPNLLDQRVNRLFRGIENRRYPQVPGISDSYDALVCLGNHDHWQGPGVMSHTWLFWEWTVNGEVVSETDLNAFTAGEHNVPLIFVAGDNVITSKTKQKLAQLGSAVKTAVTKEALGWESAACYSFETTHHAIETGVYEAILELDGGVFRPVVCPAPVTITIKLDAADKVIKALQEIEDTEYAGGIKIKFTRTTFDEAVATGARVLDLFYKPTLDELDSRW